MNRDSYAIRIHIIAGKLRTISRRQILFDFTVSPIKHDDASQRRLYRLHSVFIIIAI